MNSRRLQRTGIAGLVWGILLAIAYFSTFVFAGSTSSGSAWILGVFAILATIAFIAMVYFLGFVLNNEIGRVACYAGIGLAFLLTLMQFFQLGGATLQRILSVLLGISIVAIGVFALMQDESDAWRGFAVLLIIAGASKAIIIGDIIYPLIACAAGIVLFVAMNVAAKRAA